MKISRKMVSCLLVSSALVAAPAHALTFKKGQVLGADGGGYDGASPDQREALVLNSKRTGLFGSEGAKAGVSGSNIFVVVGEDVVFVPVSEVRGKSKEEMMDVIAAAAGALVYSAPFTGGDTCFLRRHLVAA